MKPIAYIILTLQLFYSCSCSNTSDSQTDSSANKKKYEIKLPETFTVSTLNFAYIRQVNNVPCTLYFDVDVLYKVDYIKDRNKDGVIESKSGLFINYKHGLAPVCHSFLDELPLEDLVATNKTIENTIKGFIDNAVPNAPQTHSIKITNLSTTPTYSKRVYFQWERPLK